MAIAIIAAGWFAASAGLAFLLARFIKTCEDNSND